jgi:hypothetical protein
VAFRKPYDLLADANATWKQKKAAGESSDSLRPVWYPVALALLNLWDNHDMKD